MTEITTGSIWTNSTGIVFKVTAVARTNEETWIVYAKVADSKSSFSCLDFDFLQHFKKYIGSL